MSLLYDPVYVVFLFKIINWETLFSVREHIHEIFFTYSIMLIDLIGYSLSETDILCISFIYIFNLSYISGVMSVIIFDDSDSRSIYIYSGSHFPANVVKNSGKTALLFCTLCHSLIFMILFQW